jgi:hypothetical protein
MFITDPLHTIPSTDVLAPESHAVDGMQNVL